MKPQSTIESMVRPYLQRKWREETSIIDKKIIDELGVSADDYGEIIEDVSDFFNMTSAQTRYEMDGTTILDRVCRRFRPKFYLSPPDLSISELSEIVALGEWPDDYLVPMKSRSRAP